MNETESNNSRTYANVVSTSGTQVTGYISSSSDIDYFKVTIPGKKTLSATTSIDYDVRLYNSSYSRVYYIKVYRYTGYSTTLPYVMTVSW